MTEILEARGLGKSFKMSAKQRQLEHTDKKRLIAVDNLTFTANRGEIFGLLGPNGAGKTTTLRMLATLIKPETGDALIEGFSIVKQPEEVRKRIGFLTSELKLEEFFTPSYLFDFFGSLYGASPTTLYERKNELFTRFGIASFAQTKVADLSTGMKQKASLVISIAHDPSLIIFDEPTNGLDVITAKVVTDYLEELRREGKTIILSTHIFSLAEKLCDRIGIIIAGQLAACGTLPEVKGDKSLEDAFFDLYVQQMGEGELL
jgi:sodium transport system ATP-binding protein